MTVVRLGLAPVLVFIIRWSTNMDVIYFTSGVLSTSMMFDEHIGSFPHKKNLSRTNLAFLAHQENKFNKPNFEYSINSLISF